MDINGLIDIVPAGISGAVFTFVAQTSWKYYKEKFRSKKKDEILTQKLSIEDRVAMTEQIELLLTESNRYRTEVREDLTRIKSEFDTMKIRYEKDIEQMKQHYEGEISNMKETVISLQNEVSHLRKENGALHLLLQNQGIEVPSWIQKKDQ